MVDVFLASKSPFRFRAADPLGCGKRGPYPVAHSSQRLDDDETIIVSTKTRQV